MPPDGPEPAERAFQALQRLADDGIGPRGSTAIVAQARPADDGGDPLAGATAWYTSPPAMPSRGDGSATKGPCSAAGASTVVREGPS
eukprot:13897376-Alexandrium_andersonii.AAC.1